MIRGGEFNFEFAGVRFGGAFGAVLENLAGDFDGLVLVEFGRTASFKLVVTFFPGNDGELAAVEIQEGHAFGGFEGVGDFSGDDALLAEQGTDGVLFDGVGAGEVLGAERGEGGREEEQESGE